MIWEIHWCQSDRTEPLAEIWLGSIIFIFWKTLFEGIADVFVSLEETRIQIIELNTENMIALAWAGIIWSPESPNKNKIGRRAKANSLPVLDQQFFLSLSDWSFWTYGLEKSGFILTLSSLPCLILWLLNRNQELKNWTICSYSFQACRHGLNCISGFMVLQLTDGRHMGRLPGLHNQGTFSSLSLPPQNIK